MKIAEILNEGADISLIPKDLGPVPSDVAGALPATYSLPNLRNQDPYLQYRMGLAMSAARSGAEYHAASAFGENMTIVAYSQEDQETIALALKLMGKQYGQGARLIGDPKSQESDSVNTTSPVIPRGPIQRKR